MKFRIRYHDDRLLSAPAPSNLVFEVEETDAGGNVRRSVFALDRDDLAAISALTFALNGGQPLPIETGEA